MSPSPHLRHAAAVAAALAVATLGADALANNPDCSSLPNPIYGVGASSVDVIFGKLALELAALTPPQTLVFQDGGSCTGVTPFVTPDPNLGTIPSQISGTATYWTASASGSPTKNTCTFTVPQTPDFAVSNNFATNCPGVTALPAGVGDFTGPIQTVEFIVPAGSSATAISAEAGYFTFGFDGNAKYAVTPWTTPASIFTRNNQSGTAILAALALGIPLANLTSAPFTVTSSSGSEESGVASAVPVSSGIGYVTTDVAVAATPNTIKPLAYQHYGQQCGWYPSSTATALDLINVRNGHYAIWANSHFFALVDSNHNITDTNAKNVIGWFQDTVTPPAGVDVDKIVVTSSAILDCAMEVQRSSDLGPLSSYAPDHPCPCYFEATATGTAPATCQTCTTNANCPANAPYCTRGYCEVNP